MSDLAEELRAQPLQIADRLQVLQGGDRASVGDTEHDLFGPHPLAGAQCLGQRRDLERDLASVGAACAANSTTVSSSARLKAPSWAPLARSRLPTPRPRWRLGAVRKAPKGIGGRKADRPKAAAC